MFRMFNESKIITYVPGTAPYGLNWYSLTSEAATSNNVSVNIGNVYLNETMLHMNVNAGKWTITGDVGLQNAGEGNGTMVLFGTRTAPRSTVVGNAAELVIKWSTLLDLIDNGMLWTKTGTYSSTFRPGTNFVFVDDPGSLLTLDQIPDAHKITRVNMFNELDVLNLGNGMVSAVVCIPVNVPEPATMVCLDWVRLQLSVANVNRHRVFTALQQNLWGPEKEGSPRGQKGAVIIRIGTVPNIANICPNI